MSEEERKEGEKIVKPWHRVRGEDGMLVEPNLWFDRFDAFRLMGPVRSVLGAINAEKKKANKGEVGSIPGAWFRAAKEWDWRPRAEAWDVFIREERRLEDEEDRRRARDGRKGIIRGMKSKLAREVIAMSQNEDPLTFPQVVKLAGFVLEEERRELDELPSRKIDVTTGGDKFKDKIVVLGVNLDEL